MTTDDEASLAVLIPCKPLMLYALHVLRLAGDEAPRTQTLDSVRAHPGLIDICRT